MYGERGEYREHPQRPADHGQFGVLRRPRVHEGGRVRVAEQLAARGGERGHRVPFRYRLEPARHALGRHESAGEIDESIAEFGRRIRESGQYPHLVRILESGVDPDSPLTRDERFEFGVDCMLDGIAARLKL